MKQKPKELHWEKEEKVNPNYKPPIVEDKELMDILKSVAYHGADDSYDAISAYELINRKYIKRKILTQQRTELLGDVSLIIRSCWVQVQSPTGDFDVIDPEKLNKELFNLLNNKDE